MLRSTTKRLETRTERPVKSKDYWCSMGNWNWKKDRAQACAKRAHIAARGLAGILVGVLRSYGRFSDETNPRAEPWEKYRAPLLAWWASLTKASHAAGLV